MYKFRKGHEEGQTSISIAGMSIMIDHKYATQEQMKMLFEAGCDVVQKEKEKKE